MKEHSWCADAITKCAASLPKLDAKDSKKKDGKASSSLFGGPGLLQRLGSRAGRALPLKGEKGGAAPPPPGGAGAEPSFRGNNRRFKNADGGGYVSREQQFWCAIGHHVTTL